MIQVQYHTHSNQKRKQTEKFQLIATGFTLFIVLMDPSENPSKIMTTIRIAAAVLGFAHLLCGLRYEKASALLGNHFEKILAQTAGLVLILGGVLLKLEGSNSAYLVQIIIGFFYIFGLPILIRKVKGKFELRIDQNGIHYRKFLKRHYTLPWDEITSAKINNEHLYVNSKHRSRPFHFYLQEAPLPEIKQFIENYTADS